MTPDELLHLHRFQHDCISAYHQGLRDGISKYAHWKDGVQYVGTVGTTLSEALRRISKEEESAHEQLSRRYPTY